MSLVFFAKELAFIQLCVYYFATICLISYNYLLGLSQRHQQQFMSIKSVQAVFPKGDNLLIAQGRGLVSYPLARFHHLIPYP